MLLKSRTPFFIAIGLLILGIALFTYSTRNQEAAQIFPATVNRDCAPWDGSAFRVSVQMDGGTVIHISIWQAPDIKFSKTFSFPDETGQVGYAYILPEIDPLKQLSGTVTFERVEEGLPIAGRFSFMSERGGEYVGRFEAVWGSQVMLCG